MNPIQSVSTQTPVNKLRQAPGRAGLRRGNPLETPQVLFHDCTTRFDKESEVTHVRVEVLVRRTLDDSLSRLVDPQGWSTFCAKYFVSSCKIHERDGAPVVRRGLPVPDRNAPALGTAWSGYLFEDVQAANPLLTWRVRNILRVDFQSSLHGRVPGIRMDFRLYECLWSKLGASVIPGGIDVDCGYIEVLPEPELPGVLRVTATKSLRYTPRRDLGSVGATISRALNCLAPPLVGSWMESLVLNGMAGPNSRSR